MCVICYKPANVTLPKAYARAMFASNPHGAGIAWRNGQKVAFQKGLMSFKEFWKEARLHQHQECVLHCRIRSQGSRDPKMTHPFKIPNVGLLFHNGTVSHLGSELKQSDTAELASILSGLPEGKIDKLLQILSGSWNRFCLFTRAEIVFYGDWQKLDGMRFSNLFWRPIKQATGFSVTGTSTSTIYKPLKPLPYTYCGNDADKNGRGHYDSDTNLWDWSPSRTDWESD